ncbi:MAG: sugar 3,4-ketoisomerase [Alphaproteobacteria bacterium]
MQDNKTNKLKKIEDPRGCLIVIEHGKDVPFLIKRSYFIYGTSPDEPRGFHAHKQLEQVFVCLRGQCDVLLDDGHHKQTIKLDAPDKSLYVGKMIWHEMHNFSEDCIFAAFASDLYDESDYIRDYQDFMRLAKNG